MGFTITNDIYRRRVNEVITVRVSYPIMYNGKGIGGRLEDR